MQTADQKVPAVIADPLIGWEHNALLLYKSDALILIFSFAGQLPKQHFVVYHADGPDIALVAVGLVHDHLGTGVVVDLVEVELLLGLVVELGCGVLRDSVALFALNYVIGRQRAVHHMLIREFLEALHDMVQYLHRFGLCEVAFPAVQLPS